MKYEERFNRRVRQNTDGTKRLPLPLDISWIDRTARGPGKFHRFVNNPPLPCEDIRLARRIAFGVRKNRGMV